MKKYLPSWEKNYNKTNPFVNYDISTKDVPWIKPALVCEVQFTE
ncbi:MAG TPA: hypothetical protein VJ201_00060 [Candidatus Babeliales bacterium]|nr:hypothetical protein [Candidatus Babeliales bacterium]HLC06935.1 hypothetical protein [Candidatus Babeliales bacterium]